MVQSEIPFWRDVLALTKPRITLMAVIVAAAGVVMAPVHMSLGHTIFALLGVAFLVSGSSALNMFMERDIDALMTRTKHRPLPAGRLRPFIALLVGVLCSLLALPALYFGSNPLTVFLGFASLLSYVWVYTPMKRMSSWALVVGAVPGAMPVLLGYTAVMGQIDSLAAVLFGITFFWQLPHFIAISMFRQDEYSRAGYPVVPAVLGPKWSVWLTLLTTMMLVACSVCLWWFQVGGLVYAMTSSVLGAWFIWECLQGFDVKDQTLWAKRIFLVSLIYQTLLFFILTIDVLWLSL